MCQAAVDAYGALHLLHSNAADVVIIQRDIDVTSMDIEVWDQTLAVNLRGGLLGAKHAIPHMIEAGGGAIVYMSSCAGQFGDLSRVAYGVSKAGIESLHAVRRDAVRQAGDPLQRGRARRGGDAGARRQRPGRGDRAVRAQRGDAVARQARRHRGRRVVPAGRRRAVHHGAGRERRRRDADAHAALRRADRAG